MIVVVYLPVPNVPTWPLLACLLTICHVPSSTRGQHQARFDIQDGVDASGSDLLADTLADKLTFCTYRSEETTSRF